MPIQAMSPDKAHSPASALTLISEFAFFTIRIPIKNLPCFHIGNPEKCVFCTAIYLADRIRSEIRHILFDLRIRHRRTRKKSAIWKKIGVKTAGGTTEFLS